MWDGVVRETFSLCGASRRGYKLVPITPRRQIFKRFPHRISVLIEWRRAVGARYNLRLFCSCRFWIDLLPIVFVRGTDTSACLLFAFDMPAGVRRALLLKYETNYIFLSSRGDKAAAGCAERPCLQPTTESIEPTSVVSTPLISALLPCLLVTFEPPIKVLIAIWRVETLICLWWYYIKTRIVSARVTASVGVGR